MAATYKLSNDPAKHDESIAAIIDYGASIDTDIGIVCSDGIIVYTRKMLLSLHSKVLDEVLDMTVGREVMISLDVSSEVVIGLLEFISKGVLFSSEQHVMKNVKDTAAAIGISTESWQQSDNSFKDYSLAVSIKEEEAHASESALNEAYNVENTEIKANKKRKSAKNVGQEKSEIHNDVVKEQSMIPNSAKCSLCEKTFASKSALLRHSSSHSTFKKFRCQLCEYEFTRRDVMNKHINRKHSQSLHDVIVPGFGNTNIH